jgi:hypothetical protein
MAGGCVETTSDPVRPPEVPNKAAERRDSYGRPKGAVAISMRAQFGRTTSRRLRFQARRTSRSVRIFRSVERQILRRTVAATNVPPCVSSSGGQHQGDCVFRVDGRAAPFGFSGCVRGRCFAGQSPLPMCHHACPVRADDIKATAFLGETDEPLRSDL